MKLELKHLAPYLPYGLKIMFYGDRFNEKQVVELKGIDVNKQVRYLSLNGNFDSRFIDFTKDKPILRPLSDLTKEIEHNGQKFVAMDLLKGVLCNLFHFTQDKKIFPNGYDFEDGFQYETENYSQTLEVLDFWEIKDILLEWHFDVFGLIPKGLAIDINTLKG